MLNKWQAAREAPILEVAEALGIHIIRGKTAMCFAGHDKKTASLGFTPDKGLWYCFGCNRGGSSIDLVAQALDVDPKVAVSWILDRFGTGSGSRSRQPIDFPRVKNLPVGQAKENTNTPDPEVYERLLEMCPVQESGKRYLAVRGFSEQTVESFRIGQLISPRQVEAALRKEFQVERLMRCGVLRSSRSAQGDSVSALVWWDERLIFPFFESGRVVYLQGRIIKGDGPKYLNLVGLQKPMFNAQALLNAPKGSTLVICEGITDTMAAVQLGHNSIGILGAHSFKADWATKLKNFQIVVVADGDKAGKLSAKTIRDVFAKIGKLVTVLHMKTGTDLADTLKHISRV